MFTDTVPNYLGHRPTQFRCHPKFSEKNYPVSCWVPVLWTWNSHIMLDTYVFQHYLYELIINILVHNNCFYQLHQFLQYHVLQDSKPLVRMNIYTYTDRIDSSRHVSIHWIYSIPYLKKKCPVLMRTRFDGNTCRKRRLLFCNILQNKHWLKGLKNNVFVIRCF